MDCPSCPGGDVDGGRLADKIPNRGSPKQISNDATGIGMVRPLFKSLIRCVFLFLFLFFTFISGYLPIVRMA